jgi:hypothetical protein
MFPLLIARGEFLHRRSPIASSRNRLAKGDKNYAAHNTLDDAVPISDQEICDPIKHVGQFSRQRGEKGSELFN